MIKFFKRFIVATLALLVLLVIALAIGIAFLDSNMLKANLVKRIESRLGGTITVGDISITPTPIIHVTLKEVTWARDLDQSAVKLDDVVIGIPFYQLIGKGPIDATIELNHPVITKGQSSAALKEPTSAPSQAIPIDPTSFQARLTERVTLSTLVINNGSLAIDRAQGKVALNDINLKVGPLSMSTPTKQDVDLVFSGTMTEGPISGKIGVDGQLAVDLSAHTFKTEKLKLTLGDLALVLSVDAAGDPDKLKKIPEALARFSSSAAHDSSEAQSSESSGESSGASSGLASKASSLASLTSALSALGKQELALTLRDDALTIAPISITAFGGTIDVGAKLTSLAETPAGAFDLTLKNLDAKALAALAPNAKASNLLGAIEGPLNATAHVNGRGKTKADFKASLTGTITAHLNALAFPDKKARLDGVHVTASLNNGAIVLAPLTIQTVAVSTPAIALSGVTLEGTLADGSLSLAKFNAGFLGGTLGLSGTIRQGDGGTALALHAVGDGLNLAQLPKKAEDAAKESGGILSMNVNLNGSGNTPEAIRAGLSVAGNFTIRDLPLPPMQSDKQQGPKITQMIPALRAKADAMRAQMEKIMGSRRLSILKGHIDYNGGNITLSDTHGSSENYDVALGGTITKDKSLNIRGIVALSEQSSQDVIASNDMSKVLLESDGRIHIPFVVTGKTSNPHRSLDLSALKDKLRDEIKPSDVRKAIEQRFPNAPRPGQGRGGQILRDVLGK